MKKGVIEIKANEIRKDVVKMLLAAGSGHAAGSLGMADVMATLYFSGWLNWDPDKPWKEDRDRVILSCGHICPVWYATLAHTGAFSHLELDSLRQLGSRLQGHPHYRSLPGVENTAGPLGQGLSQAVGIALAGKMKGLNYRTVCIMSDGEMQEGQIWEAAMWAGNGGLNKLIGIVDRNQIQIDGQTEQVMPVEPLADKWKAFGWEAEEIDGHQPDKIWHGLNEAGKRGKPTVLIAKTIPGKGVDYMEQKFEWHGKAPSVQEAQLALKELRTWGGKIMVED